MLKDVPCSLSTDTHIDTQTHTHTQTHTKVTTEGTLSGFQDFFLQPIIKDRPKIGSSLDNFGITHKLSILQILFDMYEHQQFYPLKTTRLIISTSI